MQKKRDFLKKTKQFTAIDDIWSRTCAFQRTHYWTPKIRVGGDPPSWKSWRHFVTATADVSGCSVWICGTCDAKASSYLGSGRMTEVIRLVLYTEVLGPWDSDCAGGRLLSTDTGLADLLPLGVLNTSYLSTISSYGSISIYLSSIVTNEDKTWYVSFYILLATQWQHSTINSIGGFQVYSGIEYEVGKRPLTGSMSVVGIRNQSLFVGYVRRLDLLLLVWKRTNSETTVTQSETTVD